MLLLYRDFDAVLTFSFHIAVVRIRRTTGINHAVNESMYFSVKERAIEVLVNSREREELLPYDGHQSVLQA